MGFSLKTAAGLNSVQVAVDIDLQQNRRVISRSAGFGWNNATETQCG